MRSISAIPFLIEGLRGLGHAGSRLNGLKGRVRVGTGILHGPIVSLLVEGGKIVNHHLGDFGILRVLGFGALEKRLEEQE